MQEQNPLVTFDPEEPSAVIRFDVPLPSFYDGKHIIDLKIREEDWSDFIRGALEQIQSQESSNPSSEPESKSLGNKPEIKRLSESIRSAIKLSDSQRIISRIGPQAEIIVPEHLQELYEDIPIKRGLKTIKPQQLERIRVPEGQTLQVSKTMTGRYMVNLAPAPVILIRPRLAVVEKYRLENYLGNYGMGKTISSFYVHPKSKVTLTIRSWTTVKETYEDASSIFDSYTTKASDNFQTTFNSERSKSSEEKESSEYYAEVKAEAGFLGIGSVEAEAGTKGSSSSSREEFSKDVRNTVSAHASESSSKREFQHHVTAQLEKDTGEEKTLIREIENLNAGHVLNFIVRELNQEYHSVLVLKDVRLVFTMGPKLFVDEVPLFKIDEFLRKYLREDDALIKTYRDYILKEYSYVKDYEGTTRQSTFEIRKYADDAHLSTDMDTAVNNYNPDDHYILIKKEKHSIGRKVGGRETGKDIEVEGVPVEVNTVTMKTDGVVCSSLLDPGLALDDYSIKMQIEAHRREKAQTDLAEADIAKHTLARHLIENGPDEAVERFVKIYGPLIKPEQEENDGSQ